MSALMSMKKGRRLWMTCTARNPMITAAVLMPTAAKAQPSKNVKPNGLIASGLTFSNKKWYKGRRIEKKNGGRRKMDEAWALLRDTGKLTYMLGLGVLRLMFSPAEDVFCPGPGMGPPCYKPYDHGREGGRCACCYLMHKDRELLYLALMM